MGDLMSNKINYRVKPGEILEDYLESEDVSWIELSKKTGISLSIICKIISGECPITPGIASLLEKAFSIEAQF